MSIDISIAAQAVSPAAVPSGRSGRPTLLRVLLERRGWEWWTVFRHEFAAAAKRAAAEVGDRRLADVAISSSTFHRWMAGDHVPQGQARVVLEAMMGVSVDLLLRPAPLHSVVVPRPIRPSSYAAALALDGQWATSTLCPTAPAPGADGFWRLAGRHVFDGTTAAVQVYEAAAAGDLALISQEDHEHLRSFVRPVRRGVVLASLQVEDLEARFVALDSAHCRRQMALDSPWQSVSIPSAYCLDDLTYAILWATMCLDDALLADDHALADAESSLGQHQSTGRSAVARAAAPALSRAGGDWLGAGFCAQHIAGRLTDVAGPAVLWAPVRSGENAAMRLLLRHQRLLMETLRTRDAGLQGCAVFLPPGALTAPCYERIWLFLLLAHWELLGLRVWVCTEAEFANAVGLALVPGRRAITADWGGGDLLWQVDVTDGRADVRAYSQALDHARVHSAVDGLTTPDRVRALADVLDLDWQWLTGRCRDLGAYGAAGMLRPRSRLISLDALDATLRAVGALAPAA
ncbi:hypothetical protein [Streptomyces sp. NPDC058280]|uniref:hypothetical protein n=1 Tax=Streptomyces sp. NPDC058280 TaxID=3346419 RepID=UPI0036F0D1F5